MNSSTTQAERAHAKPCDRFGLTGPSVVLDRRINAVRGDIADIALAGILFAPHYACPMARRCTVSSVPVRDRANEHGAQISELIFGESFDVLDLSGGWAWGYSAADHYVGYVPEDTLAPPLEGPWRVAVPEVRSNTGETLFMGARIDGIVEGGLLTSAVGALALDQLAGPDAVFDPVSLAELFLGAPYLLGGRTVRGIDCSGLVQIAYGMAGIALPRDSDLQAATGTPLAKGEARQRGDLAFFPGHVGMMIDGERMIHATAHSGNVTIEPLADVEARTTVAQVRRP